LFRPDVRTVVGHKDRHVPKKINPFMLRIAPQILPLLIEDELFKTVTANLICKLLACLGQRLLIALNEFQGPLVPGFAVKMSAQGDKESKVIQPLFMALTEFIILMSQMPIMLNGGEKMIGSPSACCLAFASFFAVQAGVIQTDPAAFGQCIQTDKFGIARMGG